MVAQQGHQSDWLFYHFPLLKGQLRCICDIRMVTCSHEGLSLQASEDRQGRRRVISSYSEHRAHVCQQLMQLSQQYCAQWLVSAAV